MRTQIFNSEAMFGYKQISTFFSDFSIAEFTAKIRKKLLEKLLK